MVYKGEHTKISINTHWHFSNLNLLVNCDILIKDKMTYSFQLGMIEPLLIILEKKICINARIGLIFPEVLL